MSKINRRQFLGSAAKTAAATAALSALPASIREALAVPAHNHDKSINDVKHIVILMQENRSFDHYFGASRGVRGFGDRQTVPLESGKSVWHQSNGTTDVMPFHFDESTMNAALIIDTPHNFPDQQAAWNQGKYGYWPKYKGDTSMGYYKRAEAPFQWALADAFTICDNYFCSLRTGTDPNRVMMWSGSNIDPARRDAGLTSGVDNAEVVNLRCWITGTFPTPGYTYYGSALPWKTIPDVLQEAGISWRIYQDPNDNWTGAMNGANAFQSFRDAKPGSAIYQNGLAKWSLDDLKNDVVNGTLPSVSWVCPSQLASEHPGAPSSPARGGDFTQQVLEALTASHDTWSKTVFIVTFDENDGLFDHLPSPAVPSINLDGSYAGKSTVDIKGMYFETDGSLYSDPLTARLEGVSNVSYPLINATDTISGNIRPWGMGARVPTYIISPWSRGGWVNSQVFDHTSIGQFIEQRFGVIVPAISPWARAVSGDLTSAFNFVTPNDPSVPTLPDMSDYAAIEAASKQLPAVSAPSTPEQLFQESGTKPSRALPYTLNTDAATSAGSRSVIVKFACQTGAGTVFHVYDMLHLDRIPRRYTVEGRKSLHDTWDTTADNGAYNLQVFGPNGFLRTFKGTAGSNAEPLCLVAYKEQSTAIRILLDNPFRDVIHVHVTDNAYGHAKAVFRLRGGDHVDELFSAAHTGGWYDFTLTCDEYPTFERRMAGRIETGRDSISDPVGAIG